MQPKRRGRPRKEDKYGGHIAQAEDIIADRLPQLIENLFALADGVTVQEPDKDGGLRVYTRPPDRQANEYLINRILGKPTESLHVSGDDGESEQFFAALHDPAPDADPPAEGDQ